MSEQTLTAADWRVAGRPDGELPIVGATYRVIHQRKGKFTAKILSVRDEWAEVPIVRGTADAICDYNVRVEGETVNLRACLCTLKQPAAPPAVPGELEPSDEQIQFPNHRNDEATA